MSEEYQFKALRLLESNPMMTQRELADALEVSLGAANYCLKELLAKGWIKYDRFQKSSNKLRYLYLLTPKGVSAKTRLAAHFLKRKLAEHEKLRSEIDVLKSELGDLNH